MRRAARTDSNQEDLRRALHRIGARTYYVKEPLDLLVAFRGRTFLMEVKTEDGRMTKAQEEFTTIWPGEWHICRTIEEAVNAAIYGGKPQCSES